MRTIGISVSRDHLRAVALDDASPAQPLATAVVPCREPFGAPDDHAALVAELRTALPGNGLPGAVITLPPSLTYVRPVKLPVEDLPRARAIHLAELEGNLPIEDDEILSDLLPAPAEAPDTFIAVAARRSLVEKVVQAFQAAGIRVDRVITDHTALMLLASGNAPADAVLLSSFSDIQLLRTAGNAVRSARQFPEALADAPDEIVSAVRDAASDGDSAPVPVIRVGDLPGALAAALPDALPCDLPSEIPPAYHSAYGAALGPLLPKVAGGFSLRTSAEAAAEKAREGRQKRIAAVAVGIAVVLAIGSLEFAVWAGNQKVARARALVRKEFAAAAPDVKLREATAGTQIREKLTSLLRQQKELGTDALAPAEMFARASQALPQGEIAVRELSLEDGRLRVAGEAGEAKLVEAYRAGLAAGFGPQFTVTVQGSEGSAKGSSVRFTILVEQKEARRAS
jgi:hypothetical protein